MPIRKRILSWPWLMVLLLVTLVGLPAPAATSAPASAATLVEVTNFGTNPSNLRMHLYVPDNVAPRPAVVVAVHYCTGSGPAFHSGTEFARLADQHGFIVIYPSATRSSKCFDVYTQQALRRNGGSDPVGIRSMVGYVQQRHNADPNRIFVTGASSGAMMTNVLLGDYPDVFAAGAAFMGVPFGCFATTPPNEWNSECANGQISKTPRQWGDLVRGAHPGYSGPRPRMQVWHGTEDSILRYPNFGEEIKQWTDVLGVSQTPVRTDSPQPGWTRTRYGGTGVLAPVEAISLQGAGHDLPRSGMAAMAIAFFGLSGGQPATPIDEDQGADCPVPNPGASTSNAKLPDPFTKIDGTRITAKSQWRCRRAEIKELAERSVYGQKPAPPASVTGTVSNTSITVQVTDQGRSSSFSASVRLPSGSGPFPAVIVLGGFGADTGTITASGAAVISYDPFTVGREGTPRNNKQGAFYSIYGSSSSTGLLLAWAWGASRIIDVIEQSGGNILRANAMGVTGCSRFGKGAFVTGVFDQRIALTMPIESGSGGAPILRGIPRESGSQPLSSAYSEQPWLGDAFGSFTSNPAMLPVDTHEMVAMVAPRGLFIMENPHIDWLGARSGSVAALGGAEVYKALGAAGNITYWSDIQDGNHCATRAEWRGPLQQNIQKFLLGTGNAPGVIRIASNKAGNLSEWRDWQTPTLTD